MLLGRNEIAISADEEPLPPTVSRSAIRPYIRQQPNKKIFGVRFHLGLYNLSNIEKEKWPHGWLRRIGEEPVIIDEVAAERSAGQIQSYLWSKGFFNARVRDTVRVEGEEANVVYSVTPDQPYTISDIRYDIQDSVLRGLVLIDTVNCLIERGMIYDVDLFQRERQRLERFIRDIGFYTFSTENIYFRIDSSLMRQQVVVNYVVSPRVTVDHRGTQTTSNHTMYRIRDIYVFPEFDPKASLTGGDEYLRRLDTTWYRGVHFVAPPGRTPVKPEVLTQSIYIAPGSLYNVTNVERTQSHLTDLRNHRLVNVSFVDLHGVSGQRRDEGMLDCIIQLTPMQRQSFTVELEGTNTGGNLGGALNLIYQNKSLLKGAEVFSMKLKGAYETLTEDVTGFKNTQQYGIEANLRIPKFMIPFPAKESFIRNKDPRTVLQAGYNYQKLPVFARSVANISLGYSWNGNKYTRFSVNPLSLNVVKLHYINPEYQAMIDTMPYFSNSLSDVMIVGGRYDFVFNNQTIQKSRDFWNIRVGFDIAGNLLDAVYRTTNIDLAPDGSYHLFRQPFAQFLKGEVDAAYNFRFSEVSSIVYRLFAGVGYPYGNSEFMPFEEQYFGGGSNDIRAWMVRTLGPGSYILPESSFINQTADMKLEANVEYRFKLFWILEGATFIDAGNIWTVRDDDDRPGSRFRFGSFLDDIAVGTGLGLRFDLKFVLLRTDFGLKLRDPQETEGSKWIPLSRPFNRKEDITMVIGIGYPF
ncbi:MAG: BamA/TamA family outer membrane protein [Bacteroidales bacterium]|nr:BamA/TamA family outer membrane protein [Bacteroidales bacterium]